MDDTSFFDKFFSGVRAELLKRTLKTALDEDNKDLTSEGIFTRSDKSNGYILAKQDTIVAGLPIIPMVLDLCKLCSDVDFTWKCMAKEGEEVKCGTKVATISAGTLQLLKAERIILNMICRMSGIANLTKQYVDALKGTGVTLLDTRKTAPGMRFPDKYGVLMGGGKNHRCDLSEMIMIKDNHIDAAGSIEKAVSMIRDKYKEKCPPIEVECRNCNEVSEAVSCKVQRIMLDNMESNMLDTALALIPNNIESEISGGVSLENIRRMVTSGKKRATFVSVGRITHSAPIADFSMKFV